MSEFNERLQAVVVGAASFLSAGEIDGSKTLADIDWSRDAAFDDRHRCATAVFRGAASSTCQGDQSTRADHDALPGLSHQVELETDPVDAGIQTRQHWLSIARHA